MLASMLGVCDAGVQLCGVRMSAKGDQHRSSVIIGDGDGDAFHSLSPAHTQTLLDAPCIIHLYRSRAAVWSDHFTGFVVCICVQISVDVQSS